jgi:membrane protein implicated in regulation of membrane protease activity
MGLGGLSQLFFYMPVIWLVIAVLLGLIEAATLGLTTLWFAVGALAAALSALLGARLPFQVIIFLLVSIAALYFTRPILLNRLRLGHEKNAMEQMAGRAGVVTEEIRPFNTGLVKVGGVIWTAVGDVPEASFPRDSRVRVVRVEGVKVIVELEGESLSYS